MRRLTAPAVPLVLVAVITSGCAAPAATPSTTANEQPATSAPQLDARTQLAGLVATAKDHRFTAGYTYRPTVGAPRTVTVALAGDGSWRVDVPGGALGGKADIALVGDKDGLFQCRTSGANPACAKAPDGSLPAWADPRVQHPFVDWLDPLTDRRAALSVAVAPLLTGARGTCFSVESDSAALTPPVDPGVYCYDADGTLTGAKADFGTLVLAAPVSPPPASVQPPAPVSGDSLLAAAAPTSTSSGQ
ncbi:hypothetical protein HC031_24390 [Planosporangium thailandense]|uniref:Lipoprotein n=1 Tax=Planosporangium thailandense TaxID=765197 RepID=A0ABX0Y5Z1_9ACTN|nr:hypothetical protein [Planosporangium thailandense]NJC72833.1 hypothetical protein [Planosporangium thailandense]